MNEYEYEQLQNDEKDENEIRESIIQNRRSVLEQTRKSTVNAKMFVDMYNVIEE